MKTFNNPPKTSISPENPWLEDENPFEMVPFFGDMLIFEGIKKKHASLRKRLGPMVFSSWPSRNNPGIIRGSQIVKTPSQTTHLPLVEVTNLQKKSTSIFKEGVPSLKLTWHLKMDGGCNTRFRLGRWPIFRGVGEPLVLGIVKVWFIIQKVRLMEKNRAPLARDGFETGNHKPPFRAS